MTLTARLSGQATPTPTSGVISASRGGQLSATFVGVPASSMPVYVALGQSSGAPATYSDISNDIGGVIPPSEGSVTLTYKVADDTYEMAVRVPVGASAYTTPNDLWAALFLFASGSPAPTDVPSATAGPIAVVA